MAPAAVLFDNDGLLLDTEVLWTRAEAALFERFGLTFTMDHKRELIGTSGARSRRRRSRASSAAPARARR